MAQPTPRTSQTLHGRCWRGKRLGRPHGTEEGCPQRREKHHSPNKCPDDRPAFRTSSAHRPGSNTRKRSGKQSTHLVLGELILQGGNRGSKGQTGEGRAWGGWRGGGRVSSLRSGRLRARPPRAPRCSRSLRSPCRDAEPSAQGQAQCRTAGRPPPEPREAPSSSLVRKQKRDPNGKVKSASTTEAGTHTP